MNTMLVAMIAIAGLCGPRVQNQGPAGTSYPTRNDAKECQVQMVKCVKAKQNASIDDALAACVQEIK